MPLTLAGPIFRERPLEAERLRLELHPMLQILERLEREVQEVARAARGVEHRERAQPVEERPVPPLGLVSPFRAGGRRPGGCRPFQVGRNPGLLRLPRGEPGSDHHRLDEQHDLVAVGVVRPELRPLVRIEPALEQRAEDRRIDLGPVQARGGQHRVDVGPLQRQRRRVVEQPAVEPVNRLEADQATLGHALEERPREVGEAVRRKSRLLQHPGEHVAGQQAHVVGEHAEDEPVDEVRDRVRVLTAFPQRLRDRRERPRRLLGERLPRLARPQPLGVRERPLELVAGRRVRQVVQAELVGPADAVRPVGADAEPLHVGDDQQRRILQRQRIQPELAERGVEIGPPALVLPGEVVPLPHVGPTVAAGILASATLEAVRLPRRVGLGRRRLAEQPAQVDEVLLRGRALLERRGAPLADELMRRHRRVQRSPCSP